MQVGQPSGAFELSQQTFGLAGEGRINVKPMLCEHASDGAGSGQHAVNSLLTSASLVMLQTTRQLTRALRVNLGTKTDTSAADNSSCQSSLTSVQRCAALRATRHLPEVTALLAAHTDLDRRER